MPSPTLSPRRATLALLLLAAGFAGFAPAAQADEVRLDLRDVQVVRPRERSGDRPYFVTIVFRSQLHARGSTSVHVMEREPHDWVGKPRWHRGARGGHLHAGDRATIPSWMGDIVWRDVDIVALDPRDRGSVIRAANAEIMGAIVIGLDNNNTPPHVVRNLVDRLAGEVTKILRAQVERGAIARSFASGGPAMTSSLTRLNMDFLSTGDKLKLFFQMTVGSTFNPDRITGIEAIVIPAISGLREQTGSSAIRLPDGSVTARSLVRSPGDADRTLRFDSSGADWRVRTSLRVRPTASPTADGRRYDRLAIRIDTGDDDLRGGNDNAVVKIHVRGRREPLTIDFNQRRRLRDHTAHTASVDARGIDPSAITHIVIETTLRGGVGGDNWNVKRVQLLGIAGRSSAVLLDRRGAPRLFRFTGEQPTLRLTVPAV